MTFKLVCNVCNLSGMSHSVERLPIHLPGEEVMILTAEVQQQLRQSDHEPVLPLKDNKLLAYFKFNADRLEKKENMVLYRHTPEVATWIKGAKPHWKPREGKFKKIGRIYSVSPSDSELWNLRILLNHVPAESYDALKTVNGFKHDTFGDAALARGLIRDDSELDNALSEAAVISMPKQMRRFFALILAHCSPVNPDKLWGDYHVCYFTCFLRSLYNFHLGTNGRRLCEARRVSRHRDTSSLQRYFRTTTPNGC